MTSSAEHPALAVLFLTHQLNLGGVATHMHALGTELMSRGIRVGIAARGLDPGKHFGEEFFRDAGFEVFQCEFYGYGVAPANIMQTIRATRRLRSIVRDFRADILDVQAATLCLGAKLSGRPYVTTFNIGVDGSSKVRLARLANRLAPSAFGAYSIAISDDVRENLIRDLHFPPDRVRKLTYTVDERNFVPATPDQRASARQQYGLSEEECVVCMVASLEPRKNHRLLLDAMAALPPGRRPVRVILAGSGWGDQLPNLLDAISSRNLTERVLYLGEQPAQTVYAASDIFVLPSLKEGFGLTVIEAMFSGLVPIRTPSEGATEQIVNGTTGYIVPFDQPLQLANRLRELADDEPLYQRLAQAALAAANGRFTRRQMADETLSLYREALGRTTAN